MDNGVVNANLLTQQVNAPPQHQKVTEKSLTKINDTRKARYDTATDVIIKELKRERVNMLGWLGRQGITVDPSSQYDDVQLQQLILYWHMLEPAAQQQIQNAKPVIWIAVPQTRENELRDAWRLNTVDNPAGSTDLSLLQKQEVNPVVTFKGKRFFQPSNIVGKVKRNVLIDTFLKPLDKYDGGWGAVVRRWEYSDLVTSESEGPTNLYGTFVFAHEFTHMQQNLFAPLYDHERKMVDARTRFLLLSNSTTAPVYRRDQALDNLIPALRAILNTEGEVVIQRSDGDDARWDFMGKRMLQPADSARIKQCLSICSRSGVATEGGVSPVAFLKMIVEDIKAVLAAPCSNQQCFAPTTDPVWIANVKGLRKYLSSKWNGVLKVNGIDMVSESIYDASQSVIDAVVDIITADKTFTSEEQAKIRTEIISLSKYGLLAANEAILSFQAKVTRSVAMQKQTSKLFGSLLGSFTEYSNGFFKNAIDETKTRLSGFIATGLGDIANNLPNIVYDAVMGLRQRLAIKTEADLAKLTNLDWYELGAPIGLFNCYTQEYDAESNAMWVTCPEELYEMYKRGGVKMDTAKTNEVLNQATYISVRGINEVGNVPKYVD